MLYSVIRLINLSKKETFSEDTNKTPNIPKTYKSTSIIPLAYPGTVCIPAKMRAHASNYVEYYPVETRIEK